MPGLELENGVFQHRKQGDFVMIHVALSRSCFIWLKVQKYIMADEDCPFDIFWSFNVNVKVDASNLRGFVSALTW